MSAQLSAFTAHRRLLFDLAYRMLGRVVEAEDVVQDTWLRWQKQDLAAVASPKAWLVTTATRLALDQLRSARHTRERYYGVWLPEPLVEAPGRSPAESTALAESLTMAFMLMLERLSPDERVVFLLREVFGHDYAEIADIVGKTAPACRQLASRARHRLRGAAAPAAAPSERAERIVRQFFAAMASGQAREILPLLRDDAVLLSDGGGRVRSAGRPIRTADRVSRLFAGLRNRFPDYEHAEFSFATINGRPGALMFSGGRLFNVYSLDVVGDRIRAIYQIRNPDKLRHLAGPN
ncbi:MAG: RNA polymerase sigma factor SigJ [Opitutae bacterium]|nr:RNA polymerase sigma factor SigJ [Opitutae bacterium]